MEKSNLIYFQELTQTLRAYQRAIPSLLVDLDRLDQNIEALKNAVLDKVDFRIVVKSLPSLPLIDYIMEKTATNKLMVFHQPFLSTIAQHYGNKVDILMGKPMPIQTADYFYKNLSQDSTFHPSKQLQWLIDTQERLQQYLALSQKYQQRLRINLEIDVGLHRGGFRNMETLGSVLKLINQHPDSLDFAGFMGYDPHVAVLPKLLRSPQKSFRMANDFYQSCIEHVQQEFPDLWHENLTLNGAGSPTLAFHAGSSSVLNDVSAGSALVKPTHFDIPTLKHFVPACFIATPILKKQEGTTLPGLEKLQGLLSFFKPAFKQSYFIYGGYWKANYYYPPKTKVNPIFGPSTNQSMINTSSQIDLEVDDFVFLRPSQSEFVFLQFGDLLITRGNKIEASWTVLQND